MSQTTKAPVTYSEYVRVEMMLHSVYMSGSPYYRAVFNHYGHTLTVEEADKLARQHSTTVDALKSEDLEAYPVKRGESAATGDYGTAHTFEALGY